MQYAALHISVSGQELSDILVAELAEYPFESFSEEPGMLTAHIAADRLAECRAEADALLSRYGVSGRYALSEDRDWNALWESGFEPVDIDGRIRIRAPYHAPSPEGITEAVILPRMAFGSGHHATTCLMAAFTADMPVAGRRGLDLGCGTGVLSVLAVKFGARSVDAVDIDEWSVRNCRENAAANGVADRVSALHGDLAAVSGRRYGFVLANINRNVLTSIMQDLAGLLLPGGGLALSGFLAEDTPLIISRAADAGLKYCETREREGWAAVLLFREGGEAPGVEEL